MHSAISGASSQPSVRVHQPGQSRGPSPYPVPVTRVRVAAAQLNLVVGDLEGNAARILEAYEQADAAGCDLVAFPELTLTGYPPEDLLLRPAFVAQARSGSTRSRPAPARRRRSSASPRPTATSTTRPRCSRDGAVQGVYRKHLLPNYAVFDEQRYFEPWPTDGPLFVIGGVRVGRHDLRGRVEPVGPILTQAAGGRRARRQHQRVAVLRGPPARARDDARHACRRRVGADRVRQPRRRSGRARLRRRVDGVRRERSSSSHAARSSPRTCSSSTSTCGPTFRRRALDPRGRSPGAGAPRGAR